MLKWENGSNLEFLGLLHVSVKKKQGYIKNFYNIHLTARIFNDPTQEDFWEHWGKTKKEKMLYTSIFSTMFSTV